VGGRETKRKRVQESAPPLLPSPPPPPPPLSTPAAFPFLGDEEEGWREEGAAAESVVGMEDLGPLMFPIAPSPRVFVGGGGGGGREGGRGFDFPALQRDEESEDLFFFRETMRGIGGGREGGKEGERRSLS